MPENEIRYGNGFLRDVRKLPREAQVKLGFLLEIMRENACAPEMHTKPLAVPLRGKYSFRITRNWRVGFMFESRNVIKLLIADHRDTIYRRLGKL